MKREEIINPNNKIMPKLYDLKMKEYIFAPRFRNTDFKTFMDLSEDFLTSDDKVIESYEKAYFAWKKHVEIDTDKSFPSQEFIF
jgi:hypothetical protein